MPPPAWPSHAKSPRGSPSPPSTRYAAVLHGLPPPPVFPFPGWWLLLSARPGNECGPRMSSDPFGLVPDGVRGGGTGGLRGARDVSAAVRRTGAAAPRSPAGDRSAAGGAAIAGRGSPPSRRGAGTADTVCGPRHMGPAPALSWSVNDSPGVVHWVLHVCSKSEVQ